MNASPRLTLLPALTLALAAAGCTSGGGGGGSALVCDATAPTCQDQHIQALFNDEATNGDFENDSAGGVITTDVDATAGGISGDEGFLYGRFTSSGLEKVEITDEESLEDMEWEIAFRRYVVRLNSGVSGPSCVQATEVAGSFDSISTPPASGFDSEDYMDGSCALIEDGTGLPGSPATLLSSFWTYPGCVSMTGQVYVLALGTGRHVKLEVLRYYESGQAGCDTGGTPGSGSGNIQVRWAFLD